MWDWLRARKEGRTSSGNGRRQSYQHLPMVRMTNTYLLAGDEDPDEIVAQTPHGVYVKKLGGGQVNTATGDFVFGTTEAYLIENGRITEPLRDANLIGNGPEVLRRIDAVATDFDMTPGTCGKDGQSVPVGCGQATLRITGVTARGHGMTASPTPTCHGARPSHRVVDRAEPGEGLEVYVARGTDTEVRAYEGEVESLTSADSSGVGIRVLVDGDGPTGAAAGSASRGPARSTPTSSRATLADARDNARFATPDPDVVLAEPDGVAASRARPLGRRRRRDPDGAEGRAGRSISSGPPAPPTPGSARSPRPTTRDSRVEVALASTTGISSSPEAHDGLPLGGRHRRRGSRHADRRGLQRRPRTRRSRPRGGDGRRRRCAPSACSAPRSRSRRAAPSCSTPRVAVDAARRISRRALSGEAVVQGPLVLRRPRRRVGGRRRPSRSSTTRPTPVAFGAAVARRRGTRLPAQRPHLRRRAPHVRLRHRLGPACRHDLDRLGRPGRLRRHARRPGAGARARRPGTMGADEILACGGRRALRAVGDRRALRREPGERRLLGRGRRPDDPWRRAWPSPSARSPSPRPCSACCSRSSRSGATCAGCPASAAGQTLAIADMPLSGE